MLQGYIVNIVECESAFFCCYRLLMFLNKKPRHSDAAYTLGQVYFDRFKYREAVEMFKRVQSMRPSDVDVQYYLARSFYGQRMYTEAVSTLQQLLKKAPEHSDAKKLLLNSLELERQQTFA